MIKYKKYSESKKGFTLIEVIVSMALLAIISVAFLSMFTSGIVGITNSGKKSTYHYIAQNQIESNISNSENLPGNVSTNTAQITLTFPENPNFNKVIDGRQIDVTYTYGSISKKLTTFTTNK